MNPSRLAAGSSVLFEQPQRMHDRQEFANVIGAMLVRPLPEDLLPAAQVHAAVFQRPGAAGTGRIHAIAFGDRRMWRKQPIPAGGGFSNLGSILSLKGLFGCARLGKDLYCAPVKPCTCAAHSSQLEKTPVLRPFQTT